MRFSFEEVESDFSMHSTIIYNRLFVSKDIRLLSTVINPFILSYSVLIPSFQA